MLVVLLKVVNQGFHFRTKRYTFRRQGTLDEIVTHQIFLRTDDVFT